jgi:hypothetical protein
MRWSGRHLVKETRWRLLSFREECLQVKTFFGVPDLQTMVKLKEIMFD